MSTDRETTRIVRGWLEEGVTRLPDPVLDVVLDQLPATAQRRATWWPARRTSTMNKFLTIGLGAAAVVLVLILGSRLLGSPTTNVGGPADETSTTSPTSTPTPTPSPSPESLLQEGPHLLFAGGAGRVRLTVNIAAPDWYGEPAGGIVVKNDTAEAPDGAGLIVFTGGLIVYGDPCNWSTTRPDIPATTVDELMAALAAQASREASEPVDITLDGYAGKSITLHVPDDAVFSTCDQATFGSWGVPGSDPAPFRYHQDPGQIDEVWAVEVDGVLTVIDWAYYEGTPQSVVDELEAIVESSTFD